MKVLIEGAGIAGIALAGFLKKGGAKVKIVEEAPHYRHGGYGILLWPLGKRILGHFGLLEQLNQRSIPIPQTKITDIKGHHLYTLDFTPVEKLYGNLIGISRKNLHELTLGKLKDLPTIFNTTIEKIEQHSNGVTVTYNTGDKEEFDIVVGADGIRSNIREKVFAEKDFSVDYYGTGLWITWLEHTENLPNHALTVLGNGAGALTFPVGENHHVIYLMAPESKGYVHETDEERLSNIRKAFKDFPWLLPKLIEQFEDPKKLAIGIP